MHNFRELQVWKDCVGNATFTYQITRQFPKEELFGLTAQMRRCAVSMASNIAEGAGRGTNAQFGHFLDIAIGSTFELETQMIIVKNLGYIDSALLAEWQT